MQPNRIHLLISFALISFAQVDASWNPFDKHSVYDKINAYLTENVHVDCGENMGACLDALRDWYEAKHKSEDNSLSKTLKRVIELNGAIGAEKCNSEGLKQIQRANHGTRGQALTKEASRPIDKLVRQVMIAHANLCKNLYQELISAAKSQLNPDDVQLASDLEVYNRNLGVDKKNADVCNEVVVASKVGKLKNLETLESLRYYSRHDPDYKYIDYVILHTFDIITDGQFSPLKKFYDMFDNYIVKSCERFEQKVGAEYLDMLKFDYDILLSTGDDLKCDKNIEDLVAMTICRSLAKDLIFRASTLKKLLKDKPFKQPLL